MGKLLEIVHFKDVYNWSVSHLMESQFNYNKEYKLVRIGDFLTRNRNRIIIEDEVEYKRVTIRINNNGIKVRDKVMGKNIGTKKQFLIKKGQFLLSKIDARNGAFGLATDEVDGAIITADFFAYEIDKSRIEPYFLVLLTTTKQFKKFAQGASSGTTGRQRIDEKKFLDVKIPLPSLEKQREIVKSYQNKINLALKQEQEIKEQEQEIQNYIYKELGIEVFNKENNENSILEFINFKDMCTKWGCISNNQLNIISNKYKIYKLKDFSQIGSGGTPSRNKKEYYNNGNIPWIKTGEVRDKIIFKTEEHITEEAIKNSSAKIYPKNSLIVAMYGATAGRTAKLGINASTNQACAVLYNINTDLIDINFLWFYLMSQIENFKLLSSGSAQLNLNSNKVKNYKIPLPPLEIQNKISTHIQKLKDIIKNLKNNAKKNRILALKEFEKGIFSET